ncbi:hypothetical protein ACFL6X_00115 [Candidatus Latescibacterota bacterium]
MVLKYGKRALERHVKRRIRLLTAGVELRRELAVDSVWANALGHTFILRRPRGEETDVRSAGTRRLGVPLSERGYGFERAGPAIGRVQAGYCIVDVFAPNDHYIASAAVAEGMSGRLILQHLGVVRQYSEQVDRLFLAPEEVMYWRELLPVVVQNRGFGYLYTRAEREGDRTEEATGDSLEIMAERFDLEEVAGYALVGKSRGGSQYRHIFAPGGEYRATVIQYGAAPLVGRGLLLHLRQPLPSSAVSSGDSVASGAASTP